MKRLLVINKLVIWGNANYSRGMKLNGKAIQCKKPFIHSAVVAKGVTVSADRSYYGTSLRNYDSTPNIVIVQSSRP